MKSVICVFILLAATMTAETPQPPVATTVPKQLVHLGDVRTDNYYWLREKGRPEVLHYLEAENNYTEEMMKPTKRLQGELYQEMLGRVQEDDSDVPYRKGNHLYYKRTETGKAYAIHCRKPLPDGPEEILLDENQLAAGHPFFALGEFRISPDERLLAYSTNTDGSETFTLRVRDLTTGKTLPDAVAKTYYTLEWAGDNKTLFYVTLDAAMRPYRVFRHRLGETEDTLVFEEKDERFELELNKSRDDRLIFIQSESKLTSEVQMLDANLPNGAFRVIWPRRQGILYYVEPHGDNLYIRTNDHAQEFRLLKVPAQNTAPENSVETIAGRADVMIEDVEAFRNYLVVWERAKGLPTVRIEDLRTGDVHYIHFEEPAYTLSSGDNEFYDAETLRFSYTSLVTPLSVFDYNMRTRARDLKKRLPVKGYDASLYTSERVLATARDGVKIPISLVYKKGFVKNGKAPALLYGYGSYGLRSDPTFRSERVSLLDRGFVYAIAHIRGGGDMGRGWYESGRFLSKKNTFYDFIDAAQYLVDHHYTAASRLGIQGGSAGGMLMGAVTNLRPDLFHVVIAQVPFVDCLTTDLDPTLPLTVGEYEEWGNANEEPAYRYIKSYSPYDNVERKNYPTMLITAGLNDPRVSYWEPAKWVAKLRAMKTDKNLLLLKTNMGGGHFGVSGRYERLKETAFIYTFLCRALGIND